MFTFPTFSYFLNHVPYRPQAVTATGQVLFHRFYCKKSFARFSVKVKLCSPVILSQSLSLLRHTGEEKENKGFLFLFLFLFFC